MKRSSMDYPAAWQSPVKDILPHLFLNRILELSRRLLTKVQTGQYKNQVGGGEEGMKTGARMLEGWNEEETADT